jgi:hypothetical protein
VLLVQSRGKTVSQTLATGIRDVEGLSWLAIGKKLGIGVMTAQGSYRHQDVWKL